MNEIIEPLELLEPIPFGTDITSISSLIVKCDTGYVCKVGEREIDWFKEVKMNQDINIFFQSMEIIEPLTINEDIHGHLKGTITCNKGYVCGVGKVEVD